MASCNDLLTQKKTLLQHFPSGRNIHQYLAPLMPLPLPQLAPPLTDQLTDRSTSGTLILFWRLRSSLFFFHDYFLVFNVPIFRSSDSLEED